MKINDSLALLPNNGTTRYNSGDQFPNSQATGNVTAALQFLRRLRREEASSAIAFANANAKYHYDQRHQSIDLDVDDYAFLRLHHRYRLPAEANSKLSNQRAGPFKVLRRVGRLAYKLDLPARWKIHSVISVTQLEPAFKTSDPYERSRPDHPDAVEDVPGDTDE